MVKLRTLRRILKTKLSERDALADKLGQACEEVDSLKKKLSQVSIAGSYEKERAVKLGTENDGLRDVLKSAKLENKFWEDQLKKSLIQIPPNDQSEMKRSFAEGKKEQGADFEFGHTQAPFKCLDCGLHFVACTWWIKDLKINCCPECSGKNLFHFPYKSLPYEIFEYIDFLAYSRSAGNSDGFTKYNINLKP